MISQLKIDVGIDGAGVYLSYERIININLNGSYRVLRIGGARLDMRRSGHNHVRCGRANRDRRISWSWWTGGSRRVQRNCQQRQSYQQWHGKATRHGALDATASIATPIPLH